MCAHCFDHSRISKVQSHLFYEALTTQILKSAAKKRLKAIKGNVTTRIDLVGEDNEETIQSDKIYVFSI